MLLAQFVVDGRVICKAGLAAEIVVVDSVVVVVGRVIGKKALSFGKFGFEGSTKPPTLDVTGPLLPLNFAFWLFTKLLKRELKIELDRKSKLKFLLMLELVLLVGKHWLDTRQIAKTKAERAPL